MEDEIELGSVIQLSPHAQTVQLTSGKVSTDDEPLISLDDVYEVTGQESINIIVKSAQEYFKHNRLHRDSLTCLKISGMEGLLPIYDRMNARKGGESFIEGFKKGFMAIMKAIADFIKQVVNWCVVKVKTMFGFAKTEKETAAAVQNFEKDVKPRLQNLIKDTFGNGAGIGTISFDEFVKSLPEGVTGKEAMLIIKQRGEKAEDAIARMTRAVDEVPRAIEEINKSMQKSRVVKNRYQQLIRDLKQKAKANNITEGDIVNFVAGLNHEVTDTLNPERCINIAQTLAEKVFGVQIEGFGLEGGFKQAQDQLKNALERTKTNVNVEALNVYQKLADNYVPLMAEADNIALDPNSLDSFKVILDNDSNYIVNKIATDYPQYYSILSDYAQFGQRVSKYNEALSLCVTVVNDCKAVGQSVVKWLTAMKTIAAAYVTQDIEKIVKAHETLTPGNEDKYVADKGAYFLADDLKILNSIYPGRNWVEEGLTYTRAISQMPDVKKRINNLLGQLSVPLKV